MSAIFSKTSKVAPCLCQKFRCQVFPEEVTPQYSKLVKNWVMQYQKTSKRHPYHAENKKVSIFLQLRLEFFLGNPEKQELVQTYKRSSSLTLKQFGTKILGHSHAYMQTKQQILLSENESRHISKRKQKFSKYAMTMSWLMKHMRRIMVSVACESRQLPISRKFLSSEIMELCCSKPAKFEGSMTCCHKTEGKGKKSIQNP